MVQVEIRQDGAVRRRYRAKGLTDKTPRTAEFSNESEQRTMTVLEYYNSQYHIQCVLYALTMIKVYMHTCPMQMKDHKEGGTGLVKWAKGLTEIFPLDLIFFTDKHSAPQQCWFKAVSLSCSGYDSACLARLS